jgi:DNA-binding protein Fis
LRLTGDNKARAARALGISPATLWRKLKQQRE